MPYMQRITWSGIALHAGVLPGYPASHGCIRLTNGFAARLWHLTKRGTRVIIAHDDVQPVEITHRQLFKPNATSGSMESRTAAVAANGNMMPAATHEAATVQTPAPVLTKVASQKVIPISVFVSRKLNKLFVRRGFTPLFDVPVKIQNPEEPLGTHVFTAMEFHNEGAAVRWTVVSMPEELPRMSRRSDKQREAPTKQIIETSPPVPPSGKANIALDRIEIPQEVVERISELLTPASSLVISDYGISRETRKDTDFIVVTQ
jgi:lipoprotein-anchoring transpeptidase ErfK/SrfK